MPGQTKRSETSGNTWGKWNNIFRSNVAIQEKWLLPFLILLPNSLKKWNRLEKRSRAMNGLSKWNGKFSFDRSDCAKWTTSRGDPEYSGRILPKRTFPFDFGPATSGIFWHNEKHTSSVILSTFMVSKQVKCYCESCCNVLIAVKEDEETIQEIQRLVKGNCLVNLPLISIFSRVSSCLISLGRCVAGWVGNDADSNSLPPPQ